LTRRCPGKQEMIVAYDTQNPGTSGAGTYDDVFVFNGALDRFDWKLVGKKEMFIGYGSFGMYDPNADRRKVVTPDGVDPKSTRYELHRVWVVEAAVKGDKRHSFAKRVFYIDEDSWALLHVDMYDAKGNLWRVQEGSLWADPEIQACTSFEYVSYDLIARRYIADGFTQEGLSLDLGAGLQGRVSDKMFNSNELRRRGER
jgi:hypothetical protein